MQREIPFYIKAAFLLLFLILMVHVLLHLKNFLTPILFAILFSYLLYPFASALERRKIPRIIANIISIIAGMAVVIAVFTIFFAQADVLVQDLPQLKKNALANSDALNDWLQSIIGRPINIAEWMKEQVNALFEGGSLFLKDLFSTTTGLLVRIFILPVFVFFVLYYRDKFKIFLIKVIPNDDQQAANTVMDAVSNVTKNYVTGITIVVFILCILNSAGLLIIGLQYAILLGVISAVFNFIPYFGTLIGGAVPFLFALLTEDSPSKALWVAVFFMFVQFTENNILTPNITGGQVKLNPFVTILALILGAMLWGLAGMLLIIPFVAVLKIVCEHVEHLKPYSYLIGTDGTEEHSLTFKKIRNFFSIKK